MAKLLPGESDPQGFGVKADSFRWVDYPLAGNVSGLTITGLDTSRDYIYGVTSIAMNSDGSWGAWSAYQMVRNATTAPSDTPTPSPTPSPTPTPVPETDRAPLTALYSATNGAGWTTRTNWLSDRPLGEWHGVTTDQSGRVIQISLPGNNLVGNISPQLGSLDNLETLDLSGNLLDGTIPSQLGRLSNLRTLDLSENQLTGAVPSQIGSLSNLVTLYLSDNQLTGELPSSLTNITSLNRLDFSGNSSLCAPSANSFQIWFRGIPNRSGPVCGQVSADKAALTALYDATNGATWHNDIHWKTDKPLGEWHGVTTDQSGRVSRIELSNNTLVGNIPPKLGDLANLEVLDLSNDSSESNNNMLTGGIPVELGRLSNLETLDLSGNELSGGIPTQLGDLSSLETLNLSDNLLTGAIPGQLGDLSSLETLDLSDSASDGKLSGSIPAQLGRLSNLETLDLSNNDLEGPLPQSLTAMTDLNYFDFKSNPPAPPDAGLCSLGVPAVKKWLMAITGPSFKGETCAQVETDRAALIALYNATDGPNWENDTNWLSDKPLGTWHGVATTTTGAVSVTEIDLRNNDLDGALPTQLGGLITLETLDLSDNHLNGAIPTQLGELSRTDLTSLNLSNNELSGAIPSELGNLIALLTLNLSENRLDGAIPSELGNLVVLRTLNLSENRLNGAIPTLPDTLTTLNLSVNSLSGNIPSALNGSNTTLLTLNLSGNRLNGGIHEMPPNLTSLNLSDNQLSGAIPAQLGSLSVLVTLNLSENQLSGAIPTQLSTGSTDGKGNLIALTHLHLNDNSLSGAIPDELGTLSGTLTHLYLSGNSGLTECVPHALSSTTNDVTSAGLRFCPAPG